jgi:hypothetical protein
MVIIKDPHLDHPIHPTSTRLYLYNTLHWSQLRHANGLPRFLAAEAPTANCQLPFEPWVPW